MADLHLFFECFENLLQIFFQKGTQIDLKMFPPNIRKKTKIKTECSSKFIADCQCLSTMLHYYQRCQKTLFFRRKHLFIHVEVAIVDRPLIIRKCGHNNGNGYSHYNKGNVYHHHDKGDDVYHHHDKGICYHQILIKTWSPLTILLSQLGGLFESNQWMIITDGMLLNNRSSLDHLIS